jgi:hypothetical protein
MTDLQSKVSNSSTKQQILSEYKKVRAQLNEALKTSLNPAEVKKSKRKQQVVEKTMGLSTDFVKYAVSTQSFKKYNPFDIEDVAEHVHIYFADGSCLRVASEEWKQIRGW